VSCLTCHRQDQVTAVLGPATAWVQDELFRRDEAAGVAA